MSVRAVLALPLYDASETLPEALESLLTQTRRDYAVLLVDEGVRPETAAIAERYRALDDRVSYHCNERRLGLTRNWRRAFELARAAYPDAEYFAWASDHDVWHPRWLEALVRALDACPDAALAFPDVAILGSDGELRLRPPTPDTTDVQGVRGVLDRIIRGRLRAGHMVYGLFRTAALERAGGFRDVLIADRLVVSEVALLGPLVRVPEVLWYRRITSPFSLARQRRSCFPGRPPLYAYVPWVLTHAAVLFWNLTVKGTQRPRIGRLEGAAAAAVYLVLTTLSTLERRTGKLWRRMRRVASARARARPTLRAAVRAARRSRAGAAPES